MIQEDMKLKFINVEIGMVNLLHSTNGISIHIVACVGFAKVRKITGNAFTVNNAFPTHLLLCLRFARELYK